MTFQYLLMANYTIYLKMVMKKLADTGLTMGQPRVLDYLYDHDGASQTEIASACLVEAASLTSTLNGMEEKGMVERRRKDGNRRSYYIFLTEKGWEMCTAVHEAFMELEKEAFSLLPAGFGDEERERQEVLHSVLRGMMERSGEA